MGNTRVTHTRHVGAFSEALPSALARIYARAVQRYEENVALAPEPKAATTVKHEEEVSHVDQHTQ